MKVTICFDDVKIIVPCTSVNVNSGNNGYQSVVNNKRLSIGKSSVEDYTTANATSSNAVNNLNENSNLKVCDVIENAIARYKKATAKV